MLTTLFRWIPNLPGTHTLEVKAYDTENQVSALAVAHVEVVEKPPMPAPPALAGDFSSERKPLIIKTRLTVRAGPGEAYEAIAVLVAGTRVVELGRSDNQQWWQILFDEPNERVGWIPADPNLVATADVDPLAVQASAPLPTATITPTNTPAPADTPVPTPTRTPMDAPPVQVPAPAVDRSPGEGPPGQGGQGMPQRGAPDLAAAAEELGVTEEALREALGDPPPDLEAAATALGVSVEALRNALGAPPEGGRP
ncbi:MAG: SH3 domain-containing protein [Chloroflexi bacterium]|nr:MAG: SH3 domain-containing protein [Chloroflexota bacterium]